MVVPPPDPLLAGLGDTIRALRAERGDISQERPQEGSGVHRNYNGRIERGERKPPTIEIIALAATLGLAPSELLARAEREAERYGATWPRRQHEDGTVNSDD